MPMNMTYLYFTFAGYGITSGTTIEITTETYYEAVPYNTYQDLFIQDYEATMIPKDEDNF